MREATEKYDDPSFCDEPIVLQATSTVMGAPDKDVRAARAPGRRRAAGARRSLLARFLLRFFEHLSQLDRKLLLLVVAVPVSACVIPAGPQFQDPAGVPDSAPSFVSYNPAIGSVQTSPFFEITATDPNVDDDLFVRWLMDFPASVPGSDGPIDHTDSPVSHGVDGKPRIQSSITAGCAFVNAPVTPHRIMVIVADQPFDPNNAGAVLNNGRSTSATWIWNVTCPPSRQ